MHKKISNQGTEAKMTQYFALLTSSTAWMSSSKVSPRGTTVCTRLAHAARSSSCCFSRRRCPRRPVLDGAWVRSCTTEKLVREGRKWIHGTQHVKRSFRKTTFLSWSGTLLQTCSVATVKLTGATSVPAQHPPSLPHTTYCPYNTPIPRSRLESE